jgi:hypothetical protein
MQVNISGQKQDQKKSILRKQFLGFELRTAVTVTVRAYGM